MTIEKSFCHINILKKFKKVKTKLNIGLKHSEPMIKLILMITLN